jgi:hypothetical protein
MGYICSGVRAPFCPGIEKYSAPEMELPLLLEWGSVFSTVEWRSVLLRMEHIHFEMRLIFSLKWNIFWIEAHFALKWNPLVSGLGLILL